eukprot:2559889-Rhodomonas_salina.3
MIEHERYRQRKKEAMHLEQMQQPASINVDIQTGAHREAAKIPLLSLSGNLKAQLIHHMQKNPAVRTSRHSFDAAQGWSSPTCPRLTGTNWWSRIQFSFLHSLRSDRQT